MANFHQQLTKAKKLQPARLQRDLFKHIRSIEKFILDKNKEQIEEDSQDINGKPIGYYSYATEIITGGVKKKGSPFTGVDTGDWFKGFYMQEVSGVVRINSKDPKTVDILRSDAWLSDDLFGLTDKNLKKVIAEKLLPFLLKHIRSILEI